MTLLDRDSRTPSPAPSNSKAPSSPPSDSRWVSASFLCFPFLASSSRLRAPDCSESQSMIRETHNARLYSSASLLLGGMAWNRNRSFLHVRQPPPAPPFFSRITFSFWRLMKYSVGSPSLRKYRSPPQAILGFFSSFLLSCISTVRWLKNGSVGMDCKLTMTVAQSLGSQHSETARLFAVLVFYGTLVVDFVTPSPTAPRSSSCSRASTRRCLFPPMPRRFVRVLGLTVDDHPDGEQLHHGRDRGLVPYSGLQEVK